jgi:hypothetical protein
MNKWGAYYLRMASYKDLPKARNDKCCWLTTGSGRYEIRYAYIVRKGL